MKIKLCTAQQIKDFNYEVKNLVSDVFLKSGRYVIDAKSIMGIFTLSLATPLDVEVVEKSEGEIDMMKSIIEKLGIAA